MKETKCDARIEKTKAALTYAFGQLLSEKSIEKITINELCNRANINRITFYNHYSDKYDFFSQLLQEINNKATKELHFRIVHSQNNIEETLLTFIEICIDAFLEYKDIILSIVHNPDNSIIVFMIKNSVSDLIKEVGNIIDNTTSNDPNGELLNAFISGGSCSLVYFWLSNIDKYSKESFIESSKLIIQGTLKK